MRGFKHGKNPPKSKITFVEVINHCQKSVDSSVSSDKDFKEASDSSVSSEKDCEEASDSSVSSEKDLEEASDSSVSSEKDCEEASDSGVSTDKDFEEALVQHRNPQSAIEIILTDSLVEHIPLTIGNFYNLTTLRLQENKLREIPWSLVYLRHLELCDLSSNCLSEISPIMGYIPSLRKLYLQHNALTYLPTSLLWLSNLQVLDVAGNCNLASPPLSMCIEGKEAIFSALNKRNNRVDMYSDVTPWYDEGKLQFQSLDHVKSASSLMQIAVDCILEFRLNYLSQIHVPPTLKNFLLRTEQSSNKQSHISKCRTCGGFFSTEHSFKNHHCKRILIN
ncbi:probable serine/threonine-protein kinase DDB_G0278509 [Haliotis rubra]|uniref:probable serine/threonine-protein kinase DDB_G0278509 n=1 Tax=Haliotis rubra TaxID=36100 RepID=UPI001EE578B9|nr:probable serine/threonine-protein kinase DDB_G0278509 [Haliotis rubra]